MYYLSIVKRNRQRPLRKTALPPAPQIHAPSSSPAHVKTPHELSRPALVPPLLLALWTPVLRPTGCLAEVLRLRLAPSLAEGLRLALPLGFRLGLVLLGLFGQLATAGLVLIERGRPVPAPLLAPALRLALALAGGLAEPVDGLVELTHLLAEPRHDPGVLQRLLGGHPPPRLPAQYPPYEVGEQLVAAALPRHPVGQPPHAHLDVPAPLEDGVRVEGLPVPPQPLVLPQEVLGQQDLELLSPEVLLAVAALLGPRKPDRAHEVEQLLDVLAGGEEGVASLELDQHAGEAPHVDGEGVGLAEDDLGGAVVAGLEVGVELLALEAAGAEVGQLEPRLAPPLHEDVLGLDVAVHHPLPPQQQERVEQLHREHSDRVVVEGHRVVAAQQLVEVAVQQLEGNALSSVNRYHVPPEHGEVPHPHHPAHPCLVPLLQVHQHLHLHVGLPQQLPAPPHYLQRLQLPPPVVVHSQHLPERALVDEGEYLVAIGHVVADLVLVELAGSTTMYPYSGEAGSSLRASVRSARVSRAEEGWHLGVEKPRCERASRCGISPKKYTVEQSYCCSSVISSGVRTWLYYASTASLLLPLCLLPFSLCFLGLLLLLLEPLPREDFFLEGLLCLGGLGWFLPLCMECILW